MNRNQALKIAKQNYQAHSAARIACDFKGGPAVNETSFGYRRGWYTVGEFSFNTTDVTGQPYDVTQGGWAYL